MSIYNDGSILKFVTNALRLSRKDFGLPEAKTRGLIAHQCRVGYIGSDYAKGGVVLVGHSSSLAEKRGEEVFRVRDQQLAAAVKNVQGKAVARARDLAILMEVEARLMQTWRLWWAIGGVLERTGLDLKQIAFTNVIPFHLSSPSDANSTVIRVSTERFFSPWLKALKPSTVVWIGKAARTSVPETCNALIAQSYIVSRQRNLPMERRFSDLPNNLSA